MKHLIYQILTRKVFIQRSLDDIELCLMNEDPHKLYTISSEEIGEGGFSKVYKAVNETTKEEFAMKVASINDIRQVCTELLMQVALAHPNIVTIDRCYSYEDDVYVSVNDDN